MLREIARCEDIFIYTYLTKKNFGLLHVYFLYTVFRAKYRALFSKVTCLLYVASQIPSYTGAWIEYIYIDTNNGGYGCALYKIHSYLNMDRQITRYESVNRQIKYRNIYIFSDTFTEIVNPQFPHT